jgi:hypothetical protein
MNAQDTSKKQPNQTDYLSKPGGRQWQTVFGRFQANDKGDIVMANEIRITGRGMVISTRASGVICACDSRHRILRVPLEGGVIAELLQERIDNHTADPQYRDQVLVVKYGSNASMIEF